MEQAIKIYKTAHEAHAKCEQQVKDIWNEYTKLDKDATKAKKKLLKQRSAAIVRCGNLSQKKTVAEKKMIEAIVKS